MTTVWADEQLYHPEHAAPYWRKTNFRRPLSCHVPACPSEETGDLTKLSFAFRVRTRSVASPNESGGRIVSIFLSISNWPSDVMSPQWVPAVK